MEEEVIEVTKVSLSMRGTWVRQTTGEKPDFTGLKFYVKLSDKSSIKYADWESFEADGGRYIVNGGTLWGYSEGMQPIVFYLSDRPDIRLSKSINIQKKVKEIETITPKRSFESGDSIFPEDFIYKVRFTDNSVLNPGSTGISLNVTDIPKGFTGKFKCIFIYEYDGISVFKEQEIDVNRKVYSLESVSSGLGSSRFIIGGREVNEAYYSCSLEDPVIVNIRAVPFSSNHRFKKWTLIAPDSPSIRISDEFSPEAVLEIPVGYGDDIKVYSIWDSAITDTYGNTYEVNGNRLTSASLICRKAVIPSSVEVICSKVFFKSDIEEVIFPERLTDIDFSAFEGCTNLTHIEIPSKVEFIGNLAFKGCTSLKSVKFNQSKPFTLGRECFKDCSSLTSLDFLNLKGNFIKCVFGDDYGTDVWSGCKIRVVKITKDNFMSDAVKVSSDSPLTVRAPGLIKVTASSRKDMVRARVIGTTSDGTASGISLDVTRNNAITKQLSKTEDSIQFSLNSYDHGKTYDMRESCGCYLVGEGNTHFDVEAYGLGSSLFSYELYVGVYAQYRFTPVGSDTFFHEGEIGEGFTNWHMMDYVNDVLYPNMRTEDGIPLINLMIPLYNRRIF